MTTQDPRPVLAVELRQARLDAGQEAEKLAALCRNPEVKAKAVGEAAHAVSLAVGKVAGYALMLDAQGPGNFEPGSLDSERA